MSPFKVSFRGLLDYTLVSFQFICTVFPVLIHRRNQKNSCQKYDEIQFTNTI